MTTGEDLRAGQATIDAHIKSINHRLTRIEKVIIGNGTEGLIAKVARQSVVSGMGGGALSILVATVIGIIVMHVLT
ncbi:hypothetical protein KAR91_60985 [Candidatus Pacearchaeota archaeon]|nr:hypothetical protein [Candidatus Pacearchaeota archaeon]